MEVKIEDLIKPKFMPGEVVYIRRGHSNDQLTRGIIKHVKCDITIHKDGRNMNVGYVIGSETWYESDLFHTPNEAFGITS